MPTLFNQIEKSNLSNLTSTDNSTVNLIIFKDLLTYLDICNYVRV